MNSLLLKGLLICLLITIAIGSDYVTREEYDALKQRVLLLEKSLVQGLLNYFILIYREYFQLSSICDNHSTLLLCRQPWSTRK
jgi:hypothetical protein